MSHQQILARIETTGIIPVIRAKAAEDANFAVEALLAGGIDIAEITLTVPGAVELIGRLVRSYPGLCVGAGTVLNRDAAARCLEAGAKFIVSPGLNLQTVEFVTGQRVPIMAGALTPTEIMLAREAGADMVKIFPCAHVGGASYIKALRGPFPDVPFVPTGGVNLKTCAEFIDAGAAALGIGSELISQEALKNRDHTGISELCKNLVSTISEVRARKKGNV